jgi:short-subunit dehydrogenase
MPYQNETILIVGASSGIGRELSVLLASKGARLILAARREDELLKLQKELGEQHTVYPIDVSDLQQVSKMFEKLDKVIQRVIFLPALYKPAPIVDMDLDFASKMVDVNLKGALYFTKEVLALFKRQGYGQIALCGSVAGYTGLPNGQPYSATKAAIINLAESLYAEAPQKVDVKLINPGFVSTAMTDKNNFKMPMIITPKQAAKAIAKGLNQKRFEIHFPKKFTYLLKVLGVLPYKLKLFILKRMPKN